MTCPRGLERVSTDMLEGRHVWEWLAPYSRVGLFFWSHVGGWRLGLWRPNPSASLSGGGMSETLGLKLRNLELSCLMVWLSIRFFLLELKEVCSPIYNYEL